MLPAVSLNQHMLHMDQVIVSSLHWHHTQHHPFWCPEKITTSVVILFLPCKKFQSLACFNEKEFKSLNQFPITILELLVLSLQV